MSYSIAFTETTRGLYATWRMFLRDARGAEYFDNSYTGAVRSYWAVLWALPIYMLAKMAEIATPATSYYNVGELAERSGWLAAGLAEFSVFTLCMFVAWPIVVDRLAGVFDCEKNFFRYVAAYNWMHVPFVLLGLLFWTGKMTGIIHDGNSLIAALSVYGIIWSYHWFVLRHALGINAGYAAMLVALEFIVTVSLKDIIFTTAL